VRNSDDDDDDDDSMWKKRCAYRVSVGKSERKRPLERPRRRTEDNIKMHLQEVEWGHGAG
jgi:hypothetical protein